MRRTRSLYTGHRDCSPNDFAGPGFDRRPVRRVVRTDFETGFRESNAEAYRRGEGMKTSMLLLVLGIGAIGLGATTIAADDRPDVSSGAASREVESR